jgi:hypothetical protein
LIIALLAAACQPSPTIDLGGSAMTFKLASDLMPKFCNELSRACC